MTNVYTHLSSHAYSNNILCQTAPGGGSSLAAQSVSRSRHAICSASPLLRRTSACMSIILDINRLSKCGRKQDLGRALDSVVSLETQSGPK